jgi:hypothetical protein
MFRKVSGLNIGKRKPVRRGMARVWRKSYCHVMNAISDGPQTLKFVHTYGAGLHGTESDPDVNDPRWQRRQVEDFVQFAVETEELGSTGSRSPSIGGGVPLGGVASDARHVNREFPGTAAAAQRGVLGGCGLGVLRLVRVPRGDSRVLRGQRVFVALASHNPGLSHSPDLWHNPGLSAGPTARHQGCPPPPP